MKLPASEIKKAPARQKGFSLVEVIVAALIAALIGIAAVALLNTRAAAVADGAEFQEAATHTESALSALTADPTAVPSSGGAFERISETEVELKPCSDSTCDFILDAAAGGTGQTSPAKGFLYSAPLPADTRKIFLRRWRTDDAGGEYNLKRVTVAVFKSEESTSPIVIEESVVPRGR